MSWFKSLAVIVVGLFVSACISITPTPILIGDLVEQNNKVVLLYGNCSEGANYVPSKEGCDPRALEKQTKTTMGLSKEFISADIKQPQGYDIYLATAMIYFRIGQRNTKQYTEAEKIARQFFEIQKATSGSSIDSARFYWVIMATAHASWQWHYDRLALDADRKTELLLCLAEGRIALNNIEDAIRRMRLFQHLVVLEAITDSLD